MRWYLSLLLVLVLVGCSTVSDAPVGILEVTILPEEAGTGYFSVTLKQGWNSTSESFFDTGNNIGTIAASPGRYDLVIWADIDYVAVGTAQEHETAKFVMSDVEISADSTTSITAHFRPKTQVWFDSFAVTRYSTATLTLQGLRADSSGVLKELSANCTESGYPGLRTFLVASDVELGSTPRTATLHYSGGWDYFTDNGVFCSFDGIDSQGRPAKIDRFE